MQRDDPDAELMLAFRDGDDAALDALYRRWAPALRRYLERMVKNEATAEELVQESFVRVHGARKRYEAEARFSTWLFHIGRNLALNELDRARRKRPHVSTEASADLTERGPSLVLVSKEPAADDVIEARQAGERMEALLAELPERQRSALWLAAVEGYSYAEIAQVLETSASSVKALVHRARTTLAERMERSGHRVAEVVA